MRPRRWPIGRPTSRLPSSSNFSAAELNRRTAQILVHHDDCHRHCSQEITKVAVGGGKFAIAILQLFIDSSQLFIGGLKLFFVVPSSSFVD